MNTESPFIFKEIDRFDARGMRRCSVPGVGMGMGDSSSNADFWRRRDGHVAIRFVWMGYDWSFEARRSTGEAIGDSKKEMGKLAEVVSTELYRWMTEDAADIPPFDEW